MDDQQFTLVILSIVFGTGFAVFVLGNLFKLFRVWIERRHPVKPSDLELRDEFEEFRQRAEKRIQVLESIVVEKDGVNEKHLLNDQIEETRHSLEDQPRLKNMLRS